MSINFTKGGICMKGEAVTKNIRPQNKNFNVLKQNFPLCFNKNGNFDFNKFKQELSKNKDIDFIIRY